MIGKRARLAAVMAGLLFGASGSAAEAGATIITFDPPQSVYTTVSGINNHGTVVGTFSDASVHGHGFVRMSDGTITTFDMPHSKDTAISGINDKGTFVGSFEESGGERSECFVQKAGGKLTRLKIQGSTSCAAYSINSSDVMVGYSTGGPTGAFIWDKGVIAPLDVPGYPIQINDAGVVTGWYFESLKRVGGFIRASDGTVTTFEVTGAVRTEPTSINAGGEIAGWYYTKTSPQRVFVRAVDGTITTFQYGTIAGATTINKRGQIAGYLGDKAGAQIGFIRSSDGTAVKKFDVVVDSNTVFPIGMNDHGEVAGFYIDSAPHGFVRTR